MTQHKYAFQGFNKELMARAIGKDLGISTKQSIEICNYLRGRKLSQAKTLLENVIKIKQAIPFKRFMNGLGHKPGKMAAGRYPIKAAKEILSLLGSVEANAQTKGLNTSELEIIHINANKAHKPVHYGRHHGREFKRSHVEVVVQETASKEKKTERKQLSVGSQQKEKKAEEKKEAPVKEDKKQDDTTAEKSKKNNPKEDQEGQQ